MQIETWLRQDINGIVKVHSLMGQMFSQDSQGNLVGVECYQDGVPYAISGTVSGNVIRADGTTVAVVSGSHEGNRAWIVLPAAAYAVVGQITIIIKVTYGTEITTLAAAVGMVYASSTDTIVDPGIILTSIQALIAQINTATASIPADYSSLWTSLAPAYSTSKTYAVGDYCTYEGDLYRCVTAITTAESFTTAHWEDVDIGADVSGLGDDLAYTKSGTAEINLAEYASTIVPYTVSGTNTVTKTSTANAYQSYQIPRRKLWDRLVVSASSNKSANVLFLKAHLASDLTKNTSVASSVATGESGRHTISANGSETLDIPNDCTYILIFKTSNSEDTTPAYVGAESTEKAQYDHFYDAVAEQKSHDYAELGKGLYEEQYVKSTISPTWESGKLLPNGEIASSGKHIRTGYIPVYNGIPIEIDCPDTIKCTILKYSSSASTSYFTGIARDYIAGSQRQTVDSAYIRICACFADGSDISTSDASNITLSRYANQEADNVSFAMSALDGMLDKSVKTITWEQGNISVSVDPTTGQGTASTVSSTKHIRSNYIKLKAGSPFRIDFPENYVAVTVYEFDAQSAVGYTETLVYENASGCFVYTESDSVSIRIVAKYVSGANILPAAGSDITLTLYTAKKELNILVIGNSFSQDSFAYLPPVLNEALPEYVINYGVAYTQSASLQNHVTWYNASTKYTAYREWSQKTGAWRLYTSTGDYDRGKTLEDIMGLRDWDIIYVQPASKIITDADHTAEWYIQNRIIYPGRKLLEILKTLASKPFVYLMGEWLSTDSNGDHGVTVFSAMSDAMELIANSIGVDGIIPIGTAFQNARSNATLQALGSSVEAGGNMLSSDNTHMQSGIPALLATYTIADYILRMLGIKRGIQASSFIPTDDNCIAIKAWKANNGNPKMTHEASVGVGSESVALANMAAAQEIAVMAIRKPHVITDCSNIFTDTYTAEPS